MGKLFENYSKSIQKVFENYSKLFENCSKTIPNCSRTIRKVKKQKETKFHRNQNFLAHQSE